MVHAPAIGASDSGSQPAPWRATRNARTKMDGIANQIVMESKANAKLEGLAAKRDLVSVLVKANMSPSLPESQRLTHAEVIARKPSSILTPCMWRVYSHAQRFQLSLSPDMKRRGLQFHLAECYRRLISRSTATAWALHALSQHTAVQIKLRNELLSLSTDNPTMEELNSLPYLETVVREVMRERLTTQAEILHLKLLSLRFPCPCCVHAEDGNGGRYSSSFETVCRQGGEVAQ
jgi:hypothetical protein